MRIFGTLLILPLLLLPAISTGQSPTPTKSVKAVKFGKLWDAHGKLWTNAIGLIDDDTHLTQYTDETPGQPMLKQLTANPPAYELFLARKGALRTLEAGVTTVRDLGADQYLDIAMRDLI